jgi:hypothetical protein
MKNNKKFNWKEKRKFSTYEEADTLRNTLLEEGVENVKIRRCDLGGINFKVIIGTPVKTNKKENNKNTNKRKDT